MDKKQFLAVLDDTTPDVSQEIGEDKYVFGFSRGYLSELMDKLEKSNKKIVYCQNLEWNVYYFSNSNNRIQHMNVFKHRGFYSSVLDAMENIHEKIEFAAKIRGELMYYFWSKAEYEVLISDWTSVAPVSTKIDIYDQIMMNFDRFIDYLWGFADD